IHGEFAQEMVNKYGLLACPPDESTIQMFGLNDSSSIACLIQQLAQGPSEISNFTILLNCLKYLCKCDKRPLFMW
ncbi:speriolin-like isoform X2, partial [Biomphalaria glabrata]